MFGSLVYTHWDSFSSVTHRMHYAGTFIDCVGTLVLCHRSTHCAWTFIDYVGTSLENILSDDVFTFRLTFLLLPCGIID